MLKSGHTISQSLDDTWRNKVWHRKNTGNISFSSVSGEIINVKFGPDKQPTSTLFIKLLRLPRNMAIQELKYIYH